MPTITEQIDFARERCHEWTMSTGEDEDQAQDSFLSKERARLRKDFHAINEFMFQRQQAGELTKEQASQIDQVYLQIVVRDAGIADLGSTEIDVAVMKHANHSARAALKRLLPAHANEIDGLDSTPRR
jgi:hypothetical protein